MDDQITHFLKALARALPGNYLENRKTLEIMESDIRADFRPDQFRPGLGNEIGSRFDTVPTFHQLSQAIRETTGALAAAVTVGAAQKWVALFCERYKQTRSRAERDSVRSMFLTFAPPDAQAMARAQSPEMFPVADEDKADLDWWWGRVEQIDAIRNASLCMARALETRALLIGPYPNGRMPHPRPTIIAALDRIIRDLKAEGVQPYRPERTRPRSVEQVTKAMKAPNLSPHGPSGATMPVPRQAPAARSADRNPGLEAAVAAFRREAGIVPIQSGADLD